MIFVYLLVFVMPILSITSDSYELHITVDRFENDQPSDENVASDDICQQYINQGQILLKRYCNSIR